MGIKLGQQDVLTRNHKMRIRPITPMDAQAIREILCNTPEFDEEDVDYCMDYVNDISDDRWDYVFVCVEEANKICGFLCFDTNALAEGVIELCWIAVSKDARRKGIGRLLQEYMEGYAKKRGFRMIVAETESKPSYESARRFYLNCGYAETARVPDFYGEGNDKIIYCKRLARKTEQTAPARLRESPTNFCSQENSR